MIRAIILDILFFPIGIFLLFYFISIFNINLYKSLPEEKKENWDKHPKGNMLNREEIEKYLELCKQSIVEARKYLALKIMKITIILLAVALLCLAICAILQFFASIGK